MDNILTALWIFLPTAFANAAPVIAHNISFLNKFNAPLDFNKTFRGKRIFGDHKTIRGIIAGAVFGLIVAGVQMFISNIFSWPEQYSAGLDYQSPIILLFGFCIGFGAVAGDAIKSFFKRQMSIPPGKSWVPFDQLDFVIGGIIASLPFIILPAIFYPLGIAIALILHPTINVLAWLLRLQDKPF